jgi:hypothetical protein
MKKRVHGEGKCRITYGKERRGIQGKGRRRRQYVCQGKKGNVKVREKKTKSEYDW